MFTIINITVVISNNCATTNRPLTRSGRKFSFGSQIRISSGYDRNNGGDGINKKSGGESKKKTREANVKFNDERTDVIF